MKLRKRKIERLKLKWFQKQVIVLGSNFDHHITLTEHGEGTLTQEKLLMDLIQSWVCV